MSETGHNEEKDKKVYKGSVIVVDDEPDMCRILTKALNMEGYHVTSFTSPKRALDYISKYRPDLVLSDIRMEELNGMEVLKKVKEFDPNIAVIMITAYGTIENAIEAMKQGAFHYLRKPFQLAEVIAVVDKAIEYKRLEDDNLSYSEHLSHLFKDVEIIGDSPQMRKIKELITRIARTDSSVLIYGESGTGKELIAKAIHNTSTRSNKRFVAINCASIPETLIESELFGYERGAFTGAVKTKMGLIELANGGTLFLDEIGDLSLALQAKLLRVLQEREIQHIGGTRTIPIDIRLIAATNRILDQEIERGNFRRDLFYRLNVININLPPLRERKEDIPLLVNHFLKKYSHTAHRPGIRFSQEAMNALMNYHWPGNVRELENVIERLLVLVDKDCIEEEDLKLDILKLPASQIPYDYRAAREEFERTYIQELLEHTRGNVAAAARLAGLSRRNLYDKIERYNINVDEFKSQAEDA
ncbi:sigma-54-dependent Fis family transcriptional regulator [Candidatus Sumerlaeota bacterium]|nr:sigma-54-dependent Fis family transcriptional regulator [Candidatus Sumerlaeota bacterium]